MFATNELSISAERVLNTLIILTLITLFIWFIHLRRSRQKMYLYSSKVPGPAGLPIIGHALAFRGSFADFFIIVSKWFKDYSPICKGWLGPQLFYLISKPEYIEIVLNSPHALNRGDFYKFLAPYLEESLFLAKAIKWKKTRKLLSPAFSLKILNQYVETWVEQSHLLLENVKNFAGKGDFDMKHYLTTCIIDVIGLSALGVNMHAQTTNNYSYVEWVYLMIDTLMRRTATLRYHSDFLFKLTQHYQKQKDTIKKSRDFTNQVVSDKKKEYLKERMENHEVVTDESPKSKTFLEYLIELSYNQEKLSNDYIRGEVDTYAAAGCDTTPTALAFLMIALGINQEVQQKAYEEVIDIIGYDRDLTYEDLPKLKYLERMVKESLRVFPVAPFMIRKTTEDIDLKDGIILPANSSIVIGCLHCHRDSANWRDPLKFDPDRFLPEKMSKQHPYSYTSFSNGPRNCIGLRYGMMVVKTVVAMLLRKYIIKSGYKSIEEVELTAGIMLRPVNGFKVSVEVRE